MRSRGRRSRRNQRPWDDPELTTEQHKRLGVENLSVIPKESLKAQVGIDGHITLLGAITIEPGGHIAKHNHESVPGLVEVISAEWIEGTESGEKALDSRNLAASLENKETVT